MAKRWALWRLHRRTALARSLVSAVAVPVTLTGCPYPFVEATLPTLLTARPSEAVRDQAWVVPAHAASCPVWHAEPTIAGQTFVIDTADACTLLEQHRALVLTVSLAAWIAVAFFIVLDA